MPFFKFRYCFLLLVLLSSTATTSFAQDRDGRKFATQAVQQRLQRQYPQIIPRQRAVERSVQATRSNEAVFPKIVPVVIHVVRSPGMPIITSARIFAQLATINAAFQMKLAPTEEVRISQPSNNGNNGEGELTSISYYPLEEDPAGFLERGVAEVGIQFCITTLQTTGTDLSVGNFNIVDGSQDIWGTDDAIKDREIGVPPWASDRQLNIWVANLEEGVKGYAQLPGADETTDGIVIDYRYFGGKTHDQDAEPEIGEGKALVHLIGNYLGLRDLWSENIPCSDDYVSDTPIHNGPNEGCYPYRHISMCPDAPNTTEMTFNYMDNSADECTWAFTYGQMVRMHKVLYTAREGLLDNPNVHCLDNIEPLTEPDLPKLSATAPAPVEPLVVRVFPNPVRKQFVIEWYRPATAVKLLIYDQAGRVVLQREFSELPVGTQTEISTERWQKGLYFLHLTTAAGTQVRRLSVL